MISGVVDKVEMRRFVGCNQAASSRGKIVVEGPSMTAMNVRRTLARHTKPYVKRAHLELDPQRLRNDGCRARKPLIGIHELSLLGGARTNEKESHTTTWP